MLVIYVVVALAGFGIAYFIKMTYFPPKQTTSPQAVSKITPVPTLPGWKIYTNSSDNITFSYPPTDTIKTSSLGFSVTSLTLTQANGNLDFQIIMLPKVLAQAAGQDFDGYSAMPDNTSKVIKSPFSRDNTTETFTKIDNRSVNGLQAIDFQSISSNAPAGAQLEIGTIVESGNNVTMISTGKSNQTNLEQILSSFRSL